MFRPSHRLNVRYSDQYLINTVYLSPYRGYTLTMHVRPQSEAVHDDWYIYELKSQYVIKQSTKLSSAYQDTIGHLTDFFPNIL